MTSDQGRPLILGVLLFPGFEPLDVFGPVNMFLNLPAEKMRVVMVAEQAGQVQSGTVTQPKGAAAIADFGFDDAPPLDILLVPGGVGTPRQLENTRLMDWIKDQSGQETMLASVCTGSALLAKAGVLDNRNATSNKLFFDLAVTMGPTTHWRKSARWVMDGKVVTASGVAAGIDMSLAVIAQLFGNETAQKIADYTEYVWNKDADHDVFARHDRK